MSLRRSFANRNIIIVMLVLQLVPLVMFPPQSFASTTQEWWLPVMLAVMMIIGNVELIARHSRNLWPWYLISFGHGFNIISRLMMLWSHATILVGGVQAVNTIYVVLTVVAMLWSAGMLWFSELPEVRNGIAQETPMVVTKS